MELTSQNVESIVKDCLFKENSPENQEKAKIVEGVIACFGFDPDKLKTHKDDIVSMLMQLPEKFQESKGGGWSFLQACERQDGMQWGEHRSIDNLLCLGIAIGKAKILMPRELWSAFPGGLPYFSVVDKQEL